MQFVFLGAGTELFLQKYAWALCNKYYKLFNIALSKVKSSVCQLCRVIWSSESTHTGSDSRPTQDSNIMLAGADTTRLQNTYFSMINYIH